MNVFEKEKKFLIIELFIFIISSLASLGYLLHMVFRA